MFINSRDKNIVDFNRFTEGWKFIGNQTQPLNELILDSALMENTKRIPIKRISVPAGVFFRMQIKVEDVAVHGQQEEPLKFLSASRIT